MFICGQHHLYDGVECRLVLARHRFILRLAHRYFPLGILHDIFDSGSMNVCDILILVSFASSRYYYHRVALMWCPRVV